MDIWIVFENIDHGCNKHMTSHLTRKGAYIEAWTVLLQSYEELQEDVDDGWIGEERYKDLRELVGKALAIKGDTNPDWGSIKLDELEYHFDDFQLAVHEILDWATEVSIHKTIAQA